MTKTCKLKPKRGEVYDNGIIWQKPCGCKYHEDSEVECSKYKDRTCEYMLLKHIEQQQLEDYLLADMVV